METDNDSPTLVVEEPNGTLPPEPPPSRPESSHGCTPISIADELLKQRKKHRAIALWAIIIASIILYATFFLCLYTLHINWTMMEWVVNHTHLTYLLLALLIVPSAMLWGLARAVFKVGSSTEANEALNTLSSASPFG